MAQTTPGEYLSGTWASGTCARNWLPAAVVLRYGDADDVMRQRIEL